MPLQCPGGPDTDQSILHCLGVRLAHLPLEHRLGSVRSWAWIGTAPADAQEFITDPAVKRLHRSATYSKPNSILAVLDQYPGHITCKSWLVSQAHDRCVDESMLDTI